MGWEVGKCLMVEKRKLWSLKGEGETCMWGLWV